MTKLSPKVYSPRTGFFDRFPVLSLKQCVTEVFSFKLGRALQKRRFSGILLAGAALFFSPATFSLAQAETITTYYQSGSGFFVNLQGDVVTNAHVLSDHCETLEIHIQGRFYPAIIAALDAKRDLAVIRVQDYGAPAPLALRDPSQAAIAGETALALGFPGDNAKSGELKISPSKILKYEIPGFANIMGGDDYVTFESAVEHGNSGGPLVDSAGNVLGVVQAQTQLRIYNPIAARQEDIKNMDRAISNKSLMDFLGKNHISYQLANSHTTMDSDLIRVRLMSSVPNVRCATRTERH